MWSICMSGGSWRPRIWRRLRGSGRRLFGTNVCYNLCQQEVRLMGKELTITLPDDIYRQFENMAEASEQDVAEVVAEAAVANIPQLDVHPRWREMEREEAAFKAMHKELLVKYRDQYVAIYQGKVVDHDEDFAEI